MLPVTRFLLMTESSKEAGLSPEQCLNLMDKLRKESAAGSIYARYDLHTFLGQKPQRNSNEVASNVQWYASVLLHNAKLVEAATF